MSLGHGAGIVRNGLVFYYDAANIQKSWKGPPATNLFTVTNLNNWTKSGATTSTTTYTTPFNTPAYAITDSSTTAYQNISRSVTVANDTSTYTISVFVRKTYGATSARLGFNLSLTGGTTVSAGVRLNSDTGAASGGTIIDYGDWWYWYFSITNNATGNTSLNCTFYPATGVYNGADNVAGVGTAIIGGLMLVLGSTAARFAEGTRANNATIIDMSGVNTINPTSMVYASNNTFSFNGTTSMLSTAANYSYSNNMTWEAWVNRTSSVNTFNMIMGAYFPYISARNSNYFLFSNFIGGVQQIINTSGTVTIVNNTWYHVAASTSYDGANTTMSLYVNGVLRSSGSSVGSQSVALASKLTVGTWYPSGTDYPFNGKIDNVKAYNRTLTAAEISQNFEALRGRYGI